MKIYHFGVILALSAAGGFAQDVIQSGTVQSSSVADESVAKNLLAVDPAQEAPGYTPLTLKQKYKYTFDQIFTGPRLLALLARTAIDHAEATPGAWGSDAPSFGVRLASHFGRALIHQNAAFAIRALDHEDPRYFPSRKQGGWERTKYAVEHTFVVRNDNGSMMPAYSRFICDFGMPFVVQTWHPGGIDPPRAVRSGAINLGVGVGVSIAQEFWPDLKRKLHLNNTLTAPFSPSNPIAVTSH